MNDRSSDPFEHILDLEEKFYQEGYDAGLADGEHAGLVEGKVFGIEKGYEKALELGRIHGRVMVWQKRLQQDSESIASNTEQSSQRPAIEELKGPSLPKNSRLAKHIEGLMSMVGSEPLDADNSDDSVAKFDDCLSKAQQKAKVIAAIVSEPLNPETGSVNGGIEDAKGLNARH